MLGHLSIFFLVQIYLIINLNMLLYLFVFLFLIYSFCPKLNVMNILLIVLPVENLLFECNSRGLS